jgi:hypothetical protein
MIQSVTSLLTVGLWSWLSAESIGFWGKKLRFAGGCVVKEMNDADVERHINFKQQKQPKTTVMILQCSARVVVVK